MDYWNYPVSEEMARRNAIIRNIKNMKPKEWRPAFFSSDDDDTDEETNTLRNKELNACIKYPLYVTDDGADNVRIVNVNALFSIGTSVDLHALSKIPNTVCSFTATQATVRIGSCSRKARNRNSPSFKIYATGSIQIMGVKTEQNALEFAKWITQCIRNLGRRKAVVKNFKIIGFTATVITGKRLDLRRLAADLHTLYEPEICQLLNYSPEDKIWLQICYNGKIKISGCKTKQHVLETWNKFKHLFYIGYTYHFQLGLSPIRATDTNLVLCFCVFTNPTIDFSADSLQPPLSP